MARWNRRTDSLKRCSRWFPEANGKRRLIPDDAELQFVRKCTGETLEDVYRCGCLAIQKNSHLRVVSANGYFDLATPFFRTEHDLDRMDLPAKLIGNLEFGYYPRGHTWVYLNVDALKQFEADLDRFYDGVQHH